MLHLHKKYFPRIYFIKKCIKIISEIDEEAILQLTKSMIIKLDHNIISIIDKSNSSLQYLRIVQKKYIEFPSISPQGSTNGTTNRCNCILLRTLGYSNTRLRPFLLLLPISLSRLSLVREKLRDKLSENFL